jgi:hypothetical protein
VLGLLSALGLFSWALTFFCKATKRVLKFFNNSGLSVAKIALGNAIAIENKNIARTQILRMILSPEIKTAQNNNRYCNTYLEAGTTG